MDINVDMDMDMDTYPYPWSQSTFLKVDCDPVVAYDGGMAAYVPAVPGLWILGAL